MVQLCAASTCAFALAASSDSIGCCLWIVAGNHHDVKLIGVLGQRGFRGAALHHVQPPVLGDQLALESIVLDDQSDESVER